MKRVLVVQQFIAPGSAQDQQRGQMYASTYRAHGFAPTYIGRRPAFARYLGRRKGRLAGVMRESIAYKLAYRALDAMVRRINDFRVVHKARHQDVVHLIKVNSASLVRRLRKKTRARLVFDLADALWLPRHASAFADAPEILEAVDSVTCDNRFGLAYARRFNSSVHLWPPASQVELFDGRRGLVARRDDAIVLGWVGSALTASSLYLILESLEDVFRKHNNLHLRLVGVPPHHELLQRFEHVKYSCVARYDQEEMIGEILGMDIGLFPMFDLEESTTHGITKALVYMAGGAAVVCSPIGECLDLVKDGENGLLARGRDEWTARLDDLVRDADLRKRLANGGLATVRADYSFERCFESMAGALTGVPNA